MELKEWRRLALQSVSLFLAVLVCCVWFSEQLQEGIRDIVHAEVKPQIDVIAKATDRETNYETNQGQKLIIKPEETEVEIKELRGKIVVIDAGHGGIDEGTSSRNRKYLEKEYTLLIAERLQDLLTEKGITVYCTRTKDCYVTKKKRVRQAKQVKADLLISIHCNASSVGDTTANGLETLYSKRETNNSSLTNRKLAKIMLDEVTKETNLRKRGVIKRNRLYILGHANMPATIVEIGYMSNKEDLNFIRKESGQKKIVQGICNGIVKALEE